jgi:predicted lipoprotein with Yx(FWY)xxD motif
LTYRHAIAAGAILIAFAAAGCGGGSPSSNSSNGTTGTGAAGTTAAKGSVQVSTATVKGLGEVLVDRRGRTLYMFAPDKHSSVTCAGACATVWPPLRVPASGSATAAGSAQASLLGSDPDPAGGRKVVTYAGWPLYTYAADTGPGEANGQGVNANGGLWYVLSPAGKVIRTKASSGSGY